MDRPVWVAGSTHADEEDVLIAAHRQLRARYAQALLVLVPRHPPRFAEVADSLRAQGVNFVTRSSGAATAGNTEVFLVDKLGELLAFYAAGDVAFVGGSLVPIGGHNLLEPAALGLPVLAGPEQLQFRRHRATAGRVRCRAHRARRAADLRGHRRVAGRSDGAQQHGCQRPQGDRGRIAARSGA